MSTSTEPNQDESHARAPATLGSSHMSEQPAATNRLGAIVDVVLQFGMVWMLLIVVLVSFIMYDHFFKPWNINGLFYGVAPLGVVAIGMTFCIIGGNFDLSAGSVFAGASVAFAAITNATNVWVGFGATLVLALGCGLVNGFIITVLRVNSFIATLATASLFVALAELYSHYNPIPSRQPGFDYIGQHKIQGIWVPTYIMAILLVVLGFVLARTKFGRAVYAVGGGREAARLSGMRVKWIQVATLCITSMCAAIGGMIIASKISTGQSNISGSITLDAITIVIIGGTSLLGGEGSMPRTLVGILIWGTISNLFASKALDTATQRIIEGLILIIAVSGDTWSRSRGGRMPTLSSLFHGRKDGASDTPTT